MSTFRILAALLVTTCLAQAHTHTFEASLSGSNEDIPNSSLGIGTSTLTLDLDLNNMMLDVDFSGLYGASTSAFIYAPTTTPLTGTAGPMTPASGFPIGVTSGSFSHLFDLTDQSRIYPRKRRDGVPRLQRIDQ